MNRAEALIWWRELSETRQNELAKHYYPSLPIIAVVTIESIWNKVENNKD